MAGSGELSRRRVTFEADLPELFRALCDAKGNTDGIGKRMVAALLADPGTGELVVMAMYGVKVIDDVLQLKDEWIMA